MGKEHLVSIVLHNNSSEEWEENKAKYCSEEVCDLQRNNRK